MILSASRRTDIPCWYMDWFMNRVRAGYALARNPMNAGQVSRVPPSPEVVDGVVFWTKDAKNLLPHLDELDALGYHYYVQFTLTPYEGPLEPGLRYAGGSGAAAKRNAAHQDAQAELRGLPLKGHETITPRPAKSCKSD